MFLTFRPTSNHPTGLRPQMEFLRRFYVKHGWEVCYICTEDHHVEQKIRKDAAHAYIWNGVHRKTKRATALFANVGARVFFVENGHFPQTGFVHIAEYGLWGRHPGFKRGVDWYDVLTQADWDRFKAARAEREAKRNPRHDVLVPLQIHQDVQILNFGNGYDNQYLIDIDLGPDKWLRNHPKAQTKLNFKNADDRPLEKVYPDYERAYGVNSTLLLEMALWGAETTAIGQCYLNWHPDPDVSLAALLAMQIPDNAEDLTPWMRPLMGLEQLREVSY